MIFFEKIEYKNLNARAKEMYNFQKVSAVLANYGYTTMWLNNDWQGADFIAVHIDGTTDLKIQLKGRLAFDKKYIGKNIYMCFIENEITYIYPHDEFLEELAFQNTDNTWLQHGRWSMPKLTKAKHKLMQKYII